MCLAEQNTCSNKVKFWKLCWNLLSQTLFIISPCYAIPWFWVEYILNSNKKALLIINEFVPNESIVFTYWLNSSYLFLLYFITSYSYLKCPLILSIEYASFQILWNENVSDLVTKNRNISQITYFRYFKMRM